jgi:hypothetical protein
MSGSIFPTYFFRKLLLVLLSTIAAMAAAIIYVDIFFALLLLAAFGLNFNIAIATSRSLWTSYIPSLAMLGLGILLHFYQFSMSIYIGMAVYCVLAFGLLWLIFSSFYWRVRLGYKNMSINMNEFFYTDLDYPFWQKILAAWHKDKNRDAIQIFLSTFLSNYYIHTEHQEKLAPLLPTALKYWHEPYFSLTRADEKMEIYPIEYAFNILSNFDTLQVFCQHAQDNPDFVPELLYICQQANATLAQFIAKPNNENYIGTYFKAITPQTVDNVLQNQVARLQNLPKIQASLQQFFGLYYMAIGIAKNMRK